MKKIHHDLLLRCAKLLNIILMTVPFVLCWFSSYGKTAVTPDFPMGNYLALLLFVALYCLFGRIYEAFQISTKPIAEMVYSQGLSVLASDCVVFLVIWIAEKHFPDPLPMLGCFAGQLIMSTFWSFSSNCLYFKIFQPQPTAIIYDARRGLDKLLGKNGLDRKYSVELTMQVDDCIEDMTVLDGMRTVFISGVHSKERNIILKYCIAKDIQVMVVPRVGDIIMNSATVSHIFHFPVLNVKRYHATPEYLFLKRTLDILISIIGLIVLSPVMLIVAIAVKAYDGGPVIYSQVRLTKDGKTFRIMKYRSMRVNAEADGVARLSSGDNDSRITPVGRIIRKLRLDELPQLFNILKGDLSLVGPRPERPEIAAVYEEKMPEFALRLQAKAGLTGYAQVYGKYNTKPYDKLQMDLMYIAHPSLVEDFKIMIATVKILFMSDSTEGVEEGQVTAVR